MARCRADSVPDRGDIALVFGKSFVIVGFGGVQSSGAAPAIRLLDTNLYEVAVTSDDKRCYT
jgi:hypothetical protein